MNMGSWKHGAFALLLGLSACGGDSGDGDADNNSTDNATANNGGSSQATGGTGSASTSGQTGGSCQFGQMCTCDNGNMGFQACMNGAPSGDCMCIDPDAGPPDLGPPMPCPTDYMCQTFGGGGGFPGAGGGMSTGGASTGGSTGASTGGMAQAGICLKGGGGFSLPPMCKGDEDCTAAGLPGVKCTDFQGFFKGCVQTCNP